MGWCSPLIALFKSRGSRHILILPCSTTVSRLVTQYCGSYNFVITPLFSILFSVSTCFLIAIGTELGGCIFGVTLRSNFMSDYPLRHPTPVNKSEYLLKMLLHCIVCTCLISPSMTLLCLPMLFGVLWSFPNISTVTLRFSLWWFTARLTYPSVFNSLQPKAVSDTLELRTCCAHLLVTVLNVSMFIMLQSAPVSMLPIYYQFLLPR